MSNIWPESVDVYRLTGSGYVDGKPASKGRTKIGSACPAEIEVGIPRGLKVVEGDFQLNNYTITVPLGYVEFRDKDQVQWNCKNYLCKYPRRDDAGQKWVMLMQEQLGQDG